MIMSNRDSPDDSTGSADKADNAGTLTIDLEAGTQCLGQPEYHNRLKAMRHKPGPRMAEEMAAASPSAAGLGAVYWDAVGRQFIIFPKALNCASA